MLKIEPSDHCLVPVRAFCHMPFNSVILVADGEMVQCCHQKAVFGSVKTDDVLAVWRNSVSERVRQSTLAGRMDPICAFWGSCPYLVEANKTDKTAMVYRRFAYPTRLEICLPDKHCNIGGERPDEENPACIMCKRNFQAPPQEDLTDLLCDKARCLMPYVKTLSVLGTAEPFWKDIVFRVFERLEFWRYKSGVQFMTNTNGICLNSRVQSLFFKAVDRSHIQWSLDAATPETYKKIRRLDAFDLIVKNLKEFIRTREAHGGKGHHPVQLWNNVNLLNLDEMPEMVRQAAEWGVDSVYLLPTYDQSGVTDLGPILMNKWNVDRFRTKAVETKSVAQALGVEVIFHKSFSRVPSRNQLVQLGLRV